MVRYFCAWKDSRGVDHTSEALALAAEAKYKAEELEKERINNIKHQLQLHIKLTDIPTFVSLYERYPYHSYEYYLEYNKNNLIKFIIDNENLIKNVLNGKT